jgi:phosphatidylglycerophosphatase A
VLGLAAAWLMSGWAYELRAAAVGVVIVAGVWICGSSARRLGVHDHPAIVWDEIAGMLATLLAGAVFDWRELLLAFVLFRFFDIVKPWPIRELDHSLGGGVGIMLDDLMAAVYAAVCLKAAQLVF